MEREGSELSEEGERESVNEIFRQQGEAYARVHGITRAERRVMQDMIDCRSGATSA